MQKTHPYFHKLKALIGYSIAVVIILIALAVSGLRFILTTANLYQQEVEDLASSLMEQPVKIGGMDARLSGMVPTLIFHDVQLLSGKTANPVLTLYQVDIGLSLKDIIWQQKIVPSNITVRGVNLEITRSVDGKIKVTGVDIDGLSSSVSAQEQDSTFKNWLLQRSNIGLEDCNILWKDEQNAGVQWLFDNISLLLKNDEDRHQLLLSGNLPPALGEKIKLAIDIKGDIAKPATWTSRFYVESKALYLSPLQKYIKHSNVHIKDGMVDLKLWGDWDKSALRQLSGNIELSDFTYQFKNKKPVNLSIVSGIFDAKHDESNLWRVGVDKFFYIVNKKTWPESQFSLAFKTKGKDIDSMFVSANHIRLEALTQLAFDNNLVSNELKNKIKSYDIKGDLSKFTLAVYDKKIQSIKSDFSNLGSSSVNSLPAVRGVYGHIDFAKNKGHVVVDSKYVMLEFPGIFRNNFELNQFKADINFLNLKQGTLLNINQLEAASTDINTVSKAKVWIPAGKNSPYMDLQTYVSRGDLSKLPRFLPAGIMSKDLLSWLDKGIVTGNVHNGHFIFNGRLNEFPFRKNEGVFKADFKADDFELNFQDGWPHIEKAKINASFSGLGMALNLISGESKKNTLYDSSAHIDSFFQPELKLNLNANGTYENMVQFLVNSPILAGAKETVKTMRMQGEASSKFKMNIPLNKEVARKKPMEYQGITKIKNASVFMLDEKIDITGINGNIIFNEKGQSSEKLQAKIMGENAQLSLMTLANNQGIQINSIGKMEPGKVLKRFNIPGADKISGKTDWQGAMIFPGKRAKQSFPVLKIKSLLLGVKSDLPEGFYKTGKSKQNFNARFSFVQQNKTQVDLEFGKKASAILEIVQADKHIYLNRGSVSFSDKKAILPRKNILYVDGAVDSFAPSKWQQALNLESNKNKKAFLIYPVILNLEKLKLVIAENKDIPDKNPAVTPDDLPLISGIIKKLYFDDVFIGRLDFNSSRIKRGFHFDEVILSAENMKVLGKGDWTNSGGKQETSLDLTLSSNDFGKMLTDLGFAAIIDKGEAKAVAKLNWQAPLPRFSLKKLNGEIQLKLENGSLKEVDAGAGRMLGLFSLSALPRKLFGDFKDTFKSGFSFDEAKGEINLRNGDAYTDAFEIKSAIAEVTISGRTGVAARDYENTVTVVPDVGGTAAGVVALLGNIPAGIGIWLVNKLSGDKINEGSMRKYEISGSWDKPIVERIDQAENESGGSAE